jgi:hypothetical protein
MAAPETNVVVEWKPNVDQVAAMLRARTQDDQMQEVGTFTDATRPTDVQVQELINSASAAFAAEAGGEPCTETLGLAAQGHIALTAAMLVELSYFPEQVASSRSPFDQLKELWDAQHEGIVSAVSFSCGSGQSPGTDGGGGMAMPRWSYDEPWGLAWEAVRAPAAEFRVWCETWVGYSPMPLSMLQYKGLNEGWDVVPPEPAPPEPEPPANVVLGDWVLRPQMNPDPPFGNGDLRLNWDTPQSVDLIWIKHTDALGDDHSADIAAITAGQLLRIVWPQGENPVTGYTQYDYNVVVAPSDLGDYSEIVVAIETFVTGETNPANWNHYGQDHMVRLVGP